VWGDSLESLIRGIANTTNTDWGRRLWEALQVPGARNCRLTYHLGGTRFSVLARADGKWAANRPFWPGNPPHGQLEAMGDEATADVARQHLGPAWRVEVTNGVWVARSDI
jgi:hypothetical protein